MNKINPIHTKEAKDYLDWKLEYIKREKKKVGFFKRIIRKLFS